MFLCESNFIIGTLRRCLFFNKDVSCSLPNCTVKHYQYKYFLRNTLKDDKNLKIQIRSCRHLEIHIFGNGRYLPNLKIFFIAKSF